MTGPQIKILGGQPEEPLAIQQLESTSQGIIIPRMTTTQRNAMPGTVPDGLIIFNLTTNAPEYYDGSAWKTVAIFGSIGTVTSVALTLPSSIFDVTGSPITGAGTFAATLAVQNENKVLAGPASGADAAPTFRILTAADLASALAAPPAIGATPAAGKFNTLEATGIFTTDSGVVRKIRVVTASGAVTVATSDDIISVAKTTGAATTVNLPATPTTGQTFFIHDGKGDTATHNITITPNSGNINNAATLVLNQNFATAVVVYDGTQWQAQIATASAGVSTLAALTDVDLTGLADGDILSWDAGTSKFIFITNAATADATTTTFTPTTGGDWTSSPVDVQEALDELGGRSGGGGSGSGTGWVLLQHQESAGTAGGTATGDTAWHTLPINTIVSDIGSHASLASNEFTLQPGTYVGEAEHLLYNVDNAKVRLYDVTNSAIVAEGATVVTLSSSSVTIPVNVRFVLVITTPTVYRFEYICATTHSTSGLGAFANSGTEVYGSVSLYKTDVGSGDTSGAGSSTDNAIVRFDGTTGKTLQNSIPLIDDVGNLSLEGQQLQDYTETTATDTPSGTYDVDWSVQSILELTLTANRTLTFSNLAAGRSMTIILIQDSTGSRTITWPTVFWSVATAPVLSTAANAIDVITLFVLDDGSTVYGFYAGKGMG